MQKKSKKNQRQVRVSKFLSLVLRHRPERIGITLDPAGWVNVDDLLAACRRGGFPIIPEELKQVVAENDKQRFAFSDDGLRIRASQGHSVQVDLGYDPEVPPDVLYHGTSTRSLKSIQKNGLLRRKRHHVHLSLTPETAMKVGRRHGPPVILKIHSGRMHQDGHVFHLSANNIWLTENVPPSYIDFPQEDDTTATTIPKLKSCGVILFRSKPTTSFLLMKHPHRYDLPKGHMEPEEDELTCALRELEEETGIDPAKVQIDPDFRFVQTYFPKYKRFEGQRVEKTVVIFLGWLVEEAHVVTTEHEGCEWLTWHPGKTVQKRTIDPLLNVLEHHLAREH